MSEQHRDVFVRCISLVSELEADHRLEDAVAVLRALQVYLDALPALADGSDRGICMDLLTQYSAAARALQKERTR